jgi:dTDP-glucose 4,6-dehydratase
MRVLVTGGAGFIGSAMVRHLVRDEGAQVLNVDKLTYASNLASLAPVANDPRYALLNADICDCARMAAAFADFQPDRVVHLAAETHVDRSITNSAGFIESNITGTYKLLEAARRYFEGLFGEQRSKFRLLHVSTDEV